ncbi:class I SAM-dependent methyltransferase [Metabacillus sp. HB246100]|uniref:class I SAM-dependent methyltransferase n=1 Tax=Bacillus weihaiensis TaxID=1547283 RepID=UPI002355A83A|nr:methyltransferase domain-containing protein [Bacillus weihaiensis]
MKKTFEDFLNETNQFLGWDFSFITETDRMTSEPLSWSYGSMAYSLLPCVKVMLDMGTGGGEFLSKLRPLPIQTYATEGYEPNVSLAINRLEPLGVKVLPIESDEELPFENQFFDLILNKHESYSPKGIRRVMKRDGIFLTQQVGGQDCIEINNALGAPINSEYEKWNLQTALAELKESGFKILSSKEEYPYQRFYDLGSLIYYLNAIPWQVEKFNVDDFRENLLKLYNLIEKEGYFDVRQHRFYIKAIAI